MMLLFARFAKKKNRLFRGSENNLIKRVADAAKHKKIEHIIQLTSDNPFVDIKILKKLIKIYSIGKYDFVSNSLKDHSQLVQI